MSTIISLSALGVGVYIGVMKLRVGPIDYFGEIEDGNSILAWKSKNQMVKDEK